MRKGLLLTIIVLSVMLSFLAGSVFSASIYKRCAVISKKYGGFEIDAKHSLKTNNLYVLQYKGQTTRTIDGESKKICKFEIVELK
ncbi:hypothetical protein KAW50_03215 [candidate division WOR-3 bacterium]|nr:hypothetical protein [candidate division WOR-3 bacterium]